MDSSLFARAALTQALLVAAVFAVLFALPLEDFFEDWGIVSGPVAWIACSALTGRILSLPWPLVGFAAAAGGVAGAIVGLGVDHTLGLIVSVGVFGASCAGYEDDAELGQPAS